MAQKFKDYYGKATAELLADKIIAVLPTFKKHEFIAFIEKSVENKEFLERQDVFVHAFDQFLGSDYSKNLQTFSQILGPELQTEEGMFTHGYWLWPIGRYVERHGIKNPQGSMKFIYELTKRFTGEFAIRPLLQNDPKGILKQIILWSTDKNVHVRRLSSEGVRLNLPWSKKLTVCIEEFEDYKKILWNLRDDTSRFVQKSVGNNLNDLYKIYPEKAIEIMDEWKKEQLTPATEWIIKHGLRSTRKKKP